MDALSSSAERVDVESGVWLVGGGLGVAPFPDDWAEPMESGEGPRRSNGPSHGSDCSPLGCRMV